MPLLDPHETHTKVSGFLREAVFGFNDGLVSTFAVIAGLTGGMVENKTVLLAAMATLIAGAFSMGLGTYLGSKAELELYESERKRELYEMKHMPELERQEIRDIYKRKGFDGVLLEQVVEKITGNPEIWLKTMMTEELGFAEKPPKPGLNGLIMGATFIIGASIPALSYIFSKSTVIALWDLPVVFLWSLVLSVIALFIAGAVKTLFTKKNVFISAIETFVVGAIAAGGSYGVGLLFGQI